MENDEKDRAYLAAIIDSSAYITLKRVREKPWHPLINISASAGKEVIAWIQSVYGGSMNWSGALRLSPKAVYAVLTDAYPFLKSKQPHADVIFEFRDSINRFREFKKGKSPLTEMPESEKFIRARLYERIQLLNGRNKEQSSPDEEIPNILEL